MRKRQAIVLLLLTSLVLAVVSGCSDPQPEAEPRPGAPSEPQTEPPVGEAAVADVSQNSDELVGVPWSLDLSMSVATEPLPDDFIITIEITAEGAVSGSSGCNRYTGRVMIGKNGQLGFGPLASTMMACPETQMTVERTYLAYLGTVTAFRMNKGNLELLDGDDVVLIYLPLE